MMLMIASRLPRSISNALFLEWGDGTVAEMPLSVTMVTPDGDGEAFQIVSADEAPALVMGGATDLAAMMHRETLGEGWRRWVIVAATLAPTPDNRLRLDGRAVNIHWHAVQGALATLQEAGIGVAWSDPEPDRIAALTRVLASRSREALIPTRRLMHPDGEALAWLSSMPGVGEATARAALAYGGGNPAIALCALTDPELPPPAGLPPHVWRQAQERVRAFLRLDAPLALTVQEETNVHN